jgi:hypothetical protein
MTILVLMYFSALLAPPEQVGKKAIFQEPKAAPPSGQPPRQFDHTSMLATAKSFFKLGVFVEQARHFNRKRGNYPWLSLQCQENLDDRSLVGR